jgi:hypothetical protein
MKKNLLGLAFVICFSFSDGLPKSKIIDANNGKLDVDTDYIKIPSIKNIDYSKYNKRISSDKVVDPKDLNNNNFKPIPKIEEKIPIIHGKNVETKELSNANKQIEQSQIKVKSEDSKNKNIEPILEIEEEDKKSSHSDTLKSLGL